MLPAAGIRLITVEPIPRPGSIRISIRFPSHLTHFPGFRPNPSILPSDLISFRLKALETRPVGIFGWISC